MRSIIESAGLRQTEVADLFQVNRGTVIRWMNGVKPKQAVAYGQALRWVRLIETAVKQGLLPLGSDIKGADRRGLIRAALKAAAGR